MSKEEMAECKCITCEHCFKWCTGKQTQISCKGDRDIIYQYWQEHKIKKDFGFIGFMKEGVFPIKKTPKWCPKAIKEK